MPQKRSYLWPAVAAVVGLAIVLVSLPQEWKTWAPSFLRSPSLHLGLDLVGGTQLDFRISEEEINAQLATIRQDIAQAEKLGRVEELNQLRFQERSILEQAGTLVEAIRTVLERRINALGVSEATITPSYVGDEKHLLVECPGIVDTQECIKVVGKTIQLEFKEEFTEATEDFTKGVRARAAATLRSIAQSGSTLQKEGEDLSSQLGVSYRAAETFFKDTLPETLSSLWGTEPSGKVVMKEGSIVVPGQDSSGKPTEQEVPGIFLVEVLTPLTQTGRLVDEAPRAFDILAKEDSSTRSYTFKDSLALDEQVSSAFASTVRSMQPGELKTVSEDDASAHVVFLRGSEKGKRQADVSHILVAFQGAQGAPAGVTRTKEEALARIKELKERIDEGEKFEDVASAETDGTTSKEAGGKLGTITEGAMPASFESVAFSAQPGTVSDPVETPYGYHLVRLDAPVITKPDSASIDDLVISGPNAKETADLLLARLQKGEVRSQETAQSFRTIFFSLLPTGWKDTPLDGKRFRSAAVTMDPVTNVPVVQIMFDGEGAKLFQELTKRNVNKRIAIFVGGQLVSAPTVQQEIAGGTAVITGSQNFDEAKELAQDLNTGAIPAPIHLVGQYTVEATLGSAALRTSLQAALVGTLVLMVYMFLMYRLLGLMADLALATYAIMLFAILKLPLLFFTSNYIVLTLAGMAGIILSIGMAVDANVLVFERMKEELRKGKLIKTAVETSFKHAWPAIRDSNVSTLITCGILFLIGSSIVRGFAITLGMGVLLSLFTAVTVTRWLLRKVAASPLASRTSLFVSGAPQAASDDRTFA